VGTIPRGLFSCQHTTSKLSSCTGGANALQIPGRYTGLFMCLCVAGDGTQSLTTELHHHLKSDFFKWLPTILCVWYLGLNSEFCICKAGALEPHFQSILL
jgi:hypothetical protein